MISIAIAYCHGLSALQPCDKDVKMSPEEYIGYLSSMSFQWVTKVIVSGYKGTLTNERKRFHLKNDSSLMSHKQNSLNMSNIHSGIT